MSWNVYQLKSIGATQALRAAKHRAWLAIILGTSGSWLLLISTPESDGSCCNAFMSMKYKVLSDCEKKKKKFSVIISHIYIYHSMMNIFKCFAFFVLKLWNDVHALRPLSHTKACFFTQSFVIGFWKYIRLSLSSRLYRSIVFSSVLGFSVLYNDRSLGKYIITVLYISLQHNIHLEVFEEGDILEYGSVLGRGGEGVVQRCIVRWVCLPHPHPSAPVFTVLYSKFMAAFCGE